jgi:hypothetical protein
MSRGGETRSWSEAMEHCNDTKRILEYCKEALSEIRTEEPTGAHWVRRWASLMALLRTACAMLEREAPVYWKKYMKTPNAAVKGRDPKKDWKPKIFGKFICTDSNLFLHQGISTTGQSRMVPIQGVSARASVAGEKLEPLPPQTSPPPPITSYHMNTGFYKGKVPQDVAEKAIAWLEKQISIAES